MAFVSYAQNAEDVMLFRALKHLTQGHYIDIGANHPVEDSVTKGFYDRGWSGINVEPVSQWFELLQQGRPRDTNLQIAISDTNEPLDFFEVAESGLSTLDAERAEHCRQEGLTVVKNTVQVWPLAQLFAQAKQPETHFLKIDVEGAEAQVIASGDWAKDRPWIVLVESTRPNTNISDHEAWEPILLNHCYRFVWFDGINRFYLAQERENLAQHFHFPVNVLDDYVTYREVMLTESRCQLILDAEARNSDFNTELDSAKYAINSAKIAHGNALKAMEELERDNKAKTTELLRANDAIKSAQQAHDNAITVLDRELLRANDAIKSAQQAHDNAITVLDRYHRDPLIRTAIRIRKIPSYTKYHLGLAVRKLMNFGIKMLDQYPQTKSGLLGYLNRHPRLVAQLCRISGRTLPGANQPEPTFAEITEQQPEAVRNLLDKMDQTKS